MLVRAMRDPATPRKLPDHVDRFARAGIEVGFAEDGPPGLAATSTTLPSRVDDVDASASFYSTIGPAAGLTFGEPSS
jgi:hypothetical protein